MLRIGICPGCEREIATDEVDDPRAGWCLNCGGTGDPNPEAIVNTRFLISCFAHDAAAEFAVARSY
jgi:hypothetical protein